jgi:fatty-acyl-CoA synthase
MPDRYAGELPVCYVALKPGMHATEAELQEHAQRTIAERPAWPKQIHVVDAIPVTSVGKIYKPQLRCDAATRVVTHVVRQELALADAHVRATEGGRRGMRVCVTLPPAAQSAVQNVEQALSAYLFEAAVAVE